MKRQSGEGSFTRLRNGKTRVQAMVNRRRGSFTSTRTGPEGLWEAKEWLRKFQLGYSTEIEHITDLLSQWLEDKKPNIEHNTYLQYERSIRLHLVPNLHSNSVSRFKAADAQKVYRTLREQNVGDRSIQVAHTVLRGAFEHAYRMEWVSENPIDRVDPPSYKAPEKEIWSLEETRNFLTFIKGHFQEHLIYVAIGTGMRQSELLGLEHSDVDMSSGYIHVRQQLIRKDKEFVFTSPKTERGNRLIRIGKLTIKHLVEQREMIDEIKMLYRGWQENDLVFPSHRGTPQWRSTATRTFKELCEKAGVPVIPFHNLRHIDATLLLSHGGFSAVGTSARLGHSRPSITTDIYGHPTTDEHQKMADYIDEILDTNHVPIGRLVGPDGKVHWNASSLMRDPAWLEANMDVDNETLAEQLGVSPLTVQRSKARWRRQSLSKS
ncbi:MAG TPA: tyrosine-type recombinase/integrase [Bellilinea sp.]|nr:tyrosine-type recombinase/integrase [Bellilinea sp.]